VNVVPIACIVEGHGEVEAVPILIRRIVATVDARIVLDLKKPIRVARNKLVKPGEIERSVELAVAKTSGRGGVLILVDADDDCPATLGPDLLRRAREARSDVPLAVVLAKREFEAWFLAAATSLAGRRGLRADLAPPPEPEAKRGAKEWLAERKTDGYAYSETTDQAALAAVFDLEQARRADSFDKCFRDVERLLREVQSSQG
jgi:Domain of unknown function (DUF4276)